MIFPEFCDGLRNRPEETLIQIPCQPLLTEILESDEQQTHNSCFEESFPLLLPSEEQQSDSDYFDLVFSSLSPWQSSIDTPESSIDISESYIDLSEWLEFAPELNSMNNEQSAAKDQPVTPQLDLSTSQKEDLVSQQPEGGRENPIDLTMEKTLDTTEEHVRLRRRRNRGDYIDFTRDQDILKEQLKEKQQRLEDLTKSPREWQKMIQDIEQLEAILGQPSQRTHCKRRRNQKISIRKKRKSATNGDIL